VTGEPQVPTVLVVDDEAALRLYMARILEDEGYTVLKAENGLEALSLLWQAEVGGVDLVITDVLMPLMGGMDLAVQLAERTWAPPVLFVSGSHTEVPGPLLRKPFLPADLTAAARNLLQSLSAFPEQLPAHLR
jgi:CheY-like chemotaxis protein